MDVLFKTDLLRKAAEQLGWSDPATLAAMVKRLERGLPAEDELCAVFGWLGQCRLVHKLDQLPYPPGAREEYRVPDLLAVFEVHGRRYPALIEVKKSVRNRLSWKPAYVSSLQRYARLLDLPLLVAWKHHFIWTMFDVNHLRVARTNLGVSFSDAMRQNLLGVLAGDFSFSFRKGAGAHLHLRKIRETTSGWDVVVEDAYLSSPDGRRHAGAEGVLPLFMCSEVEPSLSETEATLTQSFVVPADDRARFAHHALVVLLSAFKHETGPLPWRDIVVSNSLPQLPGGPQRAAEAAFRAGLLHPIMRVRPAVMPDFLRQPTDDRSSL